MKIKLYVSILTGVIFTVLSVVYAITPDVKYQISLILFLFVVLIILLFNFVMIFVDFKKYKIKAFFSFIILLGIIILTIGLNKHVFIKFREIEFNKNFNQYQTVVQLVEDGKIKLLKGCPLKLPEKYEHLAYRVWVNQSKNGILTIEFFTGGRFPVKHFGYFYCSDYANSNQKKIKKRWPYIKKIKNKWFFISD